MWLKSKNKSFLLIFVLLFSLLAPQEIFPFEKKNTEDTYARLIRIYEKWLKLENETFEMLNFKFSPIQISLQGYNLKLILEDNLGRKWIFKPDFIKKQTTKNFYYTYAQGEVATIVYRMYKLFGLETPRIHFTTLNINGKKISGSIQRFIPNVGTLSKRPPHKLSSEALSYILKAHVLDWLLANYEAKRKHFLVTSLDEKDEPKEIMRIDNDMALHLFSNDELRYDWESPYCKKISSNYYFKLWESYLLEKIDLNTEKNFGFINFISDFPDDFFIKLILSIKTHGFEEINPAESKETKQDYPHFLKLLRLRKCGLIKNFEKFYKDLAERKGKSFSSCKNIGYQEIIDSAVQNLAEEIKNMKETKSKLKTPPKDSPSIDVIFSLEGLFYLRNVYYTYWKEEKRDLIAICDNSLEKLYSLKASTKNKYEKKALKVYIENVKKIRAGKPIVFRLSEINKIIP